MNVYINESLAPLDKYREQSLVLFDLYPPNPLTFRKPREKRVF